MRLAGDVEGCDALARELLRAAAQVAEAGELPARTLLHTQLWVGAAASSWDRSTREREVRATWLAEQLALAGRAVHGFAEQLRDLHAQAARLVALAACEGLAMDRHGDIPPVLVPHGPFTDPDALFEQQRARHRAEVRARLIAQAAELRRSEDELHLRLLREVAGVISHGGIGPRAGSAPVTDVAPRAERLGAQAEPRAQRAEDDGVDAWGAAATAVSLAPTKGLRPLELASHPRLVQVGAVVRSTPGMAVVGGGLGVVADVQQGYSVQDAALKQTVIGAVGVGAGVGAALVLAPGVVAVGVGVGLGAGVGYALGKAWDAVAKPEDDREERRKRPRAKPTSAPRIDGPPPRDPGCGSTPVVSQAP